MLTDTHCHLNLEHYDEDLDEVIQRALDAGVSKILVPAVDLATSLSAVDLAEIYPAVYAAVGIHPNSSTSWQEGNINQLLDLSRHEKVAAIGEIGLDYYWDFAPKETQWKVFSLQLELAMEAGLPVIIHNREATTDVVPILLRWQKTLVDGQSVLAQRPGVMHSFSASLNEMQVITAANFFAGFTGPVTFKKAKELQQIAAEVPANRYLIETDAPYLTPHPHRGKRNEPAFVTFVARQIAHLRNLDEQVIIQETYQNAEYLFRW